MSTHIRLIGGYKPRSTPRSSEDLTLVTVIGGLSFDLSEAQLAPRTRITKVSLIGGVELTVPAGTNVIVRGLSLIGGSDVSPADPEARTP